MWQKIKNIYHLFGAIIANVWYGFPAKKLKVIGVTGTDGKTTTVSLVHHILTTAGKKSAMITSIGADIIGKTSDVGFHVTTPSSFSIQKYLRDAVANGCEYAVLEVTSHGLDQFRDWGIKYELGVLTNVTNEHLDYHKSYKAYLKAKVKLLKRSKVSIINLDDKSYTHIRKRLEDRKVLTYSLKNKKADLTLESFRFESQLIGDFNLQNCLAAVLAVRKAGIFDSVVKKALKSFTPPAGRVETVHDKDYKVIIDFAHTPNAISKFLPEIKKLTKSRLIHVFGSAGERDKKKRSEMGRVSAEHADIIILTAEDPRREKTEDIAKEIASGFDKRWREIDRRKELRIPSIQLRTSRNQESGMNKTNYIIIPDRKQAIKFAIDMAKTGDTVVLTGKAHEKSMNYGRGEEPWDEFSMVKGVIKDKSK